MNVAYTISEIIVASMAVLGNTLVVIAFRRERRLRRRTNYYIVSLAIADLLVGLLGIPCALLTSVGLPTKLYPCLFTLSLLIVLCTISIFSLVAVSVDRYWAILHPMGYSRNVRTKTAIYKTDRTVIVVGSEELENIKDFFRDRLASFCGHRVISMSSGIIYITYYKLLDKSIICACWVAGSAVGFLPLLGWNRGMPLDSQCIFTRVMDYNFLVFLYLATIVFPALLMGAFYAHIYSVVLKQLKQMVTVNGMAGGSMLRVLGAARKRDVKATKNLSIIVFFFIFCWFPLYTINFVQAFCTECHVPPLAMNSCIILSHLNSAGNPLLYAYHLTDFRAALRSLLLGTPPDQKQVTQSLTQRHRHHGHIVYKIPNNTPKMPHKIFDLDTAGSGGGGCAKVVNGGNRCVSIVVAENKNDETDGQYKALMSTTKWGSLESVCTWTESRTYHFHTHSSPPSPTKPHIILDPT